MNEDGKLLKEKLNSFQIEQLTKFFNVRHKHPHNDVCDNNTDWSKFDLWKVLDHLLEEIIEVCNLLYINAPEPKTTEKINLKQLQEECVDVANMAFILAEIAKELQIQRLTDALPSSFDPYPLKR